MKAISPPRSAASAVFQKIAFLKNDIRHYIDKDFKTGTTYEYKIVSRNLKDVTSNDSNIVRISPEAVPSPPGNIQFKAEHDSLILSWKSAGDKIFYNIYKSNEKGKYHLMPLNQEPIKETSFGDRFNIEIPVYYTIRSVTEDDTRDEGPASEEIVVDPSEFIPSSPSDIQAAVTKQSVYLSWKEPPETWVTGYKVYRELDRKEGFVLIGETQTPAYLDKDRPSTKRSYRVTAIGPSKEGPPVEIRDVVFVPFR
jgi:fibronectin type 3 domain-containing protein